MEIQLRCDQVESISVKSINIGPNRLWQQARDQDWTGRDGTGWGALMDRLVHIIISAHTWPATSTDVKDPSKLCDREPLGGPLMAPVKTASPARAASLILSPNYC